MREYTRWNNILGWVVFAIATLSYLLTMEPTTSLWDCSEFIATSYKLEVGHPPGAPLFMMLARLASLLAPSVEAVPMMINAMNCVAAGFTILFLFWTITHLARRILSREGEELSLERQIVVLGSGFVGAMAYAFTDTFWFSAVEAEVYSLSSMFTALVVWLMLKWEEEADRSDAMRWIILIAYLMGLSIGVHLLNLLAIPTLVMIYFFRRFEMRTAKEYLIKIAIALVVSLVILGAINGVIIPYTVALGAKFDTFAVNTLGLPQNVGIVVFLALVFAALGWLILYSHNRGKRALNIVALCTTVILIGFSSYASVTIRAAASPPMNSNRPSNPHALLSLLNRDQYGQRPLLWGPYYSAMPLALVYNNADPTAEDYYIPTGDYDGKSVMWYNEASGKYEPREIFEGYSYPSEANHLLPRMWSFNRRDDYEAGWVTMRDGHPEVVRESESAGVWYEPTATDDIRYFLGYQMGDMFWRYFMWNFVGRQDDVQLEKDELGTYLHGGWLSGIEFIDEIFCGPQDNLPSDMANNRARNTYFFLPLLLGLMGLIYQLNRDWRNFFVVLLLFVMTGIALVVYFNTAPNEPRERDYVYAGAFYAYSIWVGLGVMAVADILRSVAERLKLTSPKAMRLVALVAVLFSASVPAVLASENWDDHDRSNRYMARDIGMNYLTTAPKNAILINFGDNDTFPLWYCQEVEGYRTDVRVMNSSYLGGEWYIDEMKIAANDADAVPFTIPSEKYSFVNDWTIVANVVDVLDNERARRLRSEKRRIEDFEIYEIRYRDAEGKAQRLVGTYTDISKALADAQRRVEQIDPVLQQFVASGEEPDARIMRLYDEYTTSYNIYDAVLSSERFMEDYATVGDYWDYNDELSAASLNLKDAIRLFNSDKAMTLAINGGEMVLLEEGEIIAEEERKEDYRMVGRLMPRIDSFLEGNDANYLLGANSYYIPVDADAAIEAGIVGEDKRELIVERVPIKVDKSVLTKDHLLMLDLIANFDWKRPIAFTQAHLMQDYGIVDYARFDGYSYTFVPIATPYTRGQEVGSMDVDRLYKLYSADADSEEYALRNGNFDDERVNVDYFYRYNLSASRFRENYARVASALIRRQGDGDLERARELLDRGLRMLPPSNVGYTHNAILPYIRGYYYIGQHHLMNATMYLDEAVDMLAEMTAMKGSINRPTIEGGDYFSYFYDLSELAAALQSTARREGKDTTSADRLLASSDEEFNLAEENFKLGDTVAINYIAKHGDKVPYYLQFATRSSFTPMVSNELYNVALDVIEVLRTSHDVAGSFDWVANPTADSGTAQLSFDDMMLHYITAIDRITPADSTDPMMSVMTMHISNLFDVYSTLPATRYVEGREVDANYIEALDRYLSRPEVYEVVLELYE